MKMPPIPIVIAGMVIKMPSAEVSLTAGLRI